jgi:hypothetical protein
VLSGAADGTNQAYGVDAAFGFFQNVTASTFYARTVTTGRTGDNESYQAKFEWTPDRWGVRTQYLKVGADFNPEVGFLRRTDFRKSFGAFRFSPRPANSTTVRKVTTEVSTEYFVNGADDVESKQTTGRFNLEFQNSDQFTVEANANYELLVASFTVVPGAVIGSRGYAFNDALISYALGQQRRVSGTIQAQVGQFYDGHITGLTLSGARVGILKQFSVEPSVAVNHVTLPASAFTQKVYRARSDYAFSSRMFASALLQYSSTDRTFSGNLRFRWEYRPGSELFVVWTDEQDTRAGGLGTLKNRAFVVKLTRLFRF